MNSPTDSQQELSIIYRFFETRIARYIFLVIDNEPLARQLIRRIQLELNGQGKEIGHLKLKENENSIYSQVEHFLAETQCNGLLVSDLDLLIYKNSRETLSKLNKARDAFEKFQLPIGFIVNHDNLKKIIRSASDFYQMRDLPDFHFTGSVEEEKTFLDIDDSTLELYPDENLKIDFLEEQLRLREKEQKQDEHSLNHIIIPLLKIYANKRYSRKAKDLYDRYIKDRENLVKDKVVLGDYHSLVNHFKKALEYFREALKTKERIGDKNGISILFKRIGLVYQRKAEYNIALEYYQKAVEIDKEMNHIEGEALALHEIGRILKEKGEYGQALDRLQKSLAIYEKIDKSKEKASVLSHIGDLYYLKNRYEQALEYYQKALEIREKVLDKDDLDLAASYNNLSLVYKSMNRFNEAMEYQEKDLKIREKVLDKDMPELAASYNNISMLYLRMDQLEKALEYQQKALDIREKVLGQNNPDLAISYHIISTIYQDLGQVEKALEYAQNAVKNFKKIFPQGHPNMDEALENLENIEKAFFTQAQG
ncbi:MAG: tetratricopeptide repeat protein [Candidatus Aminicenantes bacterium]|nr:MAG: tetratricopeptide repeat protein [Candidatus Aminicenantes bacterium]